MFVFRKSIMVQLLIIFTAIQVLSLNTLIAAAQNDQSCTASILNMNRPADKTTYRPGQLIVQMTAGSPYQLEALNAKHGVHRVSQVFKLSEAERLSAQLILNKPPTPDVPQDIYDNAPSFEPASISQSMLSNLQRRQLRSTNAPTHSSESIYLLEMNNNEDIISAANEYAAIPAVAWAEPNYIINAKMIPNDSYYQSSNSWGQGTDDLWALKTLQLETAWDETQGEGVIIAVADTGVNCTHEDIAENVWLNEDEIPGNAIDDDQNGYVDDCYGYDFINNDADPSDDNGHGTHVAGIAAAAGNNNLGIIGVAPKAKIMALKGLSADGSGDELSMANCLYYAVNNGADIINNSWGGSGRSQLIQSAIDYAYAHGCIVVAAAGNEDGNVVNSFPANCQHVISVSGTESTTNRKAVFSNWGSGVDVSAPACGGSEDPASILSLLAADSMAAQYLPQYIVGDKYLRLAGTSASCPYVSGLAALLLAKFTTDSNDDIKGRIIASAVPIPYVDNSENEDLYYESQMIGSGMANAKRALSFSETPYIKFVNADMTVIQGNTNQVVDTGEIVKIHVILENVWKHATSVKAVLSVDPIYAPYIEEITKNTCNFGSIGQGEQQDNISDQFIIKMSKINFETPITFNLRIHADNQDQLLRFRVYPGSTNLVQDRVDITDLDGNGSKIIWVDYQIPGQKHIYSYDVAQSQYQRLTGDSATDPSDPHIFQNKAVWQDSGNIYLFDFNTADTKQLTNDAALQMHPQIYGSKVIWQDDRNGGYDLYLYDLDLAKETRISSTTVAANIADIYPRIFRNIITWWNGEQICVYDITTGQERKIAAVTANMINLGLYDNMLVYEDYRENGQGIFIYDLKSDTESVAVSPDLNPRNPYLSEGFIAYTSASGKGDIWLHDIAKGTDTQITRCYSTEDYPVIFDRKLAWLDSRNGTTNGWPGSLNTSIRMTDLSLLKPAPPLVEVSIQENKIYGHWYSSESTGPVAEFVYSLGTSECADDVVNWCSAGMTKSTILAGLNLASGTYWFNVKERDQNGAWSEPGTALLTIGMPPDLTYVNDGLDSDTEYTSRADTLSANWGGPSNPEFALKRYLYAIGSYPGGRDIVDWTDNGLSQSVTRTGLQLNQGYKYYFAVKAESTTGIFTNPVFSDGLRVDLTSPLFDSLINDGTGADIKFSSSKDTLSANWGAAADPESGILTYMCAIGTAPGTTNIVGWTDIGRETSFTRSGLNLKNSITYNVTVKAVNGAGYESPPLISNGQTVDSTPPTRVLKVNDGLFTDIKNTTSRTTLSANWLPSIDLTSGIAKYIYAIGTSPGKTDVVNWTENGRSTHTTRTGLSLIPGQRYYFTIIAINGAGLKSAPTSSNGQRVVGNHKQ